MTATPKDGSSEEQHPLLKLTGIGAGDIPINQVHVPCRETVTISPKWPWAERIPEWVSACGMTMVILFICFLSVYTFGLAISRGQASMLQYFKEYESQHINAFEAESDIFFHRIIDRNTPVPFLKYAEYLSVMAQSYSHLRINVIFLINDIAGSSYHRVSRHSRIINKLIPMAASLDVDDSIRQEMYLFQRKYTNVNMTVIALSKYMNRTPLKLQWKYIPVTYLEFYIRVYSVWKNGGIGMDLNQFYYKFVSNQYLDTRIYTVFRRFNNGLRSEENIDGEDIINFFNQFNLFINQAMNRTRYIIDKSFQHKPIATSSVNRTNDKLSSVKSNITGTAVADNDNGTVVFVVENNSTTEKRANSSEANFIKNIVKKEDADVISYTQSNNSLKIAKSNEDNNTEPGSNSLPEIIFFKFSLISNERLEPNNIPDTHLHDSNIITDDQKEMDYLSKQLIMSVDGSFVATFTRFHPFLGRLATANFRQSPKYVVEDTMQIQCGDSLHPGYCNNIMFL